MSPCYRSAGLRCLIAVVALATLILVSGPAGAASHEAPTTTVAGVLEVLHHDQFGTGRSIDHYTVRDGRGRVTRLAFAQPGPVELAGRKVRVSGRRAGDGSLHVSSPSAVAHEGEATTGTYAGETATTSVPRRTAVILANFRDKTVEPMTPAQAKDLVFGPGTSVNGWHAESSFGTTTYRGVDDAAGDVFGWVTVDYDSTDSCAYGTWSTQAREKAEALGFNDADYDHVIHVMPKNTCTFSGVAQMSGRYSWILRDAVDVTNPAQTRSFRGTTTHELGHNLGVHHAASLSCTLDGQPVSIGGTCTTSEYGDPFSTMGMGRYERHFNAYQKGRLGWLTAANTKTVTSTTTSDVLIAPLEKQSTVTQSLRVPGKRANGTSQYYYVEFRVPFGFDSPITDTADVPTPDGVTIRLASDYATSSISKLIDATPGSAGAFGDAALPVGSSFYDSATGVRITNKGIGEAGALVGVTITGATKGGKR